MRGQRLGLQSPVPRWLSSILVPGHGQPVSAAALRIAPTVCLFSLHNLYRITGFLDDLMNACFFPLKGSCVCAGITCCLLSLFACSAVYTCTYRPKLRGLYSIPGGQCADYCVHCCCPLCAICQEHRELKNRGVDPSIGWVANEEKLKKQNRTTVAPAAPPGMTRT
ncbi:hypothetical protein MLD38_021785 [Melastoma candidum]|uniref:Uncharacterized protein n=1 Tax=Melastoma candidum TaxID=119954 RepID=A0ACB9QH09_9MYRT|nr:hypothetical protein MLD38_021785 [Melastoma candidum]